MRLTTVLLIASLMQVSAAGLAQKITLSKTNAPLKTVLKELRLQSGFDFIATEALLEKSKSVNLKVKDMELEDVLENIFDEQPLSYTIENKTVTLKAKEPSFLDRVVNAFVDIDVRGVVVDGESGLALAGATVKVKGSGKATTTGSDGSFYLPGVDEKEVIVVSFIGYVTQELKAKKDLGEIRLVIGSSDLQEVNVSYNTGYQKLSPERTTGSFSVIDKELLTRRVTTNFLDRLENTVPGLLFNRDVSTPDQILVRSRSTIFADAKPLIVLDNFPYDGDLKNINPNDIENVTILKDAAAAAIWGARAGNGVIVITTKKGQSGKTKVEFNSNLTVRQKPDLKSINRIGGQDYIEIERYLFSRNYYSAIEANNKIGVASPISPVVELLIKQRDVTDASQKELINQQISNLAYEGLDRDISRYLYQQGVNQQHALNLSGQANNLNYYFSAGYDKNKLDLKSYGFDRLTLRNVNSLKLIRIIDLSFGINYTIEKDSRGNNPGYSISGAKNIYPYARIVDDKGSSQSLDLSYRKAFTDTAGNKRLVNWKYNPIDDIYQKKFSSKINDVVLNGGFKISPTRWINLELNYQFQKQQNDILDYNLKESYFVRDIVNNFTQIGSNGQLSYPVPLDGIATVKTSEITSHQGRAQLNFNNNWNGHEINSFAGAEIKGLTRAEASAFKYGYDPNTNRINFVDPFKEYAWQSNPFSVNKIPYNDAITGGKDNFISYYANVNYNFQKKYLITGSIRKDEANLFGVNTNQKGIPLFSVGGAWVVTNEEFFKVTWLNSLKAKATYGYNGNIARNTSAFTTIVTSTLGLIQEYKTLLRTPPNKDLRWEKNKVVNLGIEFSLLNDVVTGGIEYYTKKGTDLMGEFPTDQTLGLPVSFYYSNVAAMKGKGWDFYLQSKNLKGALTWQTNLIFSYSDNEVTRYLMPISSIGSSYFSTNTVNPVVGKPLFGIYSFKSAGLDPATGDPKGYLKGVPSADYVNLTKVPLDEVNYHGSPTPKYFGALRNTFTWGELILSFNISYKLGYYFRRPSVVYNTLFSSWSGHNDYAFRWKNPGDEKVTEIPSLPNPMRSDLVLRDDFYRLSESLIERADHVRLEDITLNYDFSRLLNLTSKKKSLKAYFNAANLGVLWTKNSLGIDPYFYQFLKQGKSVTFGITFGI